MPTVRTIAPEEIERRLSEFGHLLHACVAAGASVNFVVPFGPADAEAFWRLKVLPPARSGHRTVLVAEEGGTIAGSVQLGTDTPPNQPHRADVTKLLVHPDCRRRGIARSLMQALEDEARRLGRTLLTLDTRTGDAAEPLYGSLGYVTVGVIPGYSLDTARERLEATTILYKVL